MSGQRDPGPLRALGLGKYDRRSYHGGTACTWRRRYGDTPETLAPIDHLHGRGALASDELVALLEPQPGETILDIGSGLGGPARWIATKFNCTVTQRGPDQRTLRRGARTQ